MSMFLVLFKSRNKDNKEIPNFKQRTKSFLVDEKDLHDLKEPFEQFVNAGQDGELSRYYGSINARNLEKTKKILLHALIDDQVDLTKLEYKVATLSSKPECAETKYWLLDLDSNETDDLVQVVDHLIHLDISYNIQPTVNGYAIVTERGFDSRELLEKLGDKLTIKRDAMLLIDWATKGQNT